ncbi:lipocalin family protein [bacterium]|nr:lipocalin family protein [bacterium]
MSLKMRIWSILIFLACTIHGAQTNALVGEWRNLNGDKICFRSNKSYQYILSDTEENGKYKILSDSVVVLINDKGHHRNIKYDLFKSAGPLKRLRFGNTVYSRRFSFLFKSPQKETVSYRELKESQDQTKSTHRSSKQTSPDKLPPEFYSEWEAGYSGWQFTSDGRFTYKTHYTIRLGEFGWNYTKGRFKVTGNIIHLYYDDGSQNSVRFTLAGNTIIINGESFGRVGVPFTTDENLKQLIAGRWQMASGRSMGALSYSRSTVMRLDPIGSNGWGYVEITVYVSTDYNPNNFSGSTQGQQSERGYYTVKNGYFIMYDPQTKGRQSWFVKRINKRHLTIGDGVWIRQ